MDCENIKINYLNSCINSEIKSMMVMIKIKKLNLKVVEIVLNLKNIMIYIVIIE